MITDKFGRIVYSEKDIMSMYMTDNKKVIRHPILSDSAIEFSEALDLDAVPKILQAVEDHRSVDEFDRDNHAAWMMPESYKTLDIAKYVLDLCANDTELQRAGEELILYQDRDLFMMLCYLKYLVDVMRKNNILWGVGRGSSVSSFVLFLLGIHRINPIYYDLPISEFLN